MNTRSIFTLLLAASMGSAQDLQDPNLTVLPSRSFDWEWSIRLPQGELGTSDWRTWLAEKQPPTNTGRKRGRDIPGATVMVVERYLDIHQERVMAFNAALAPVLRRSFQVGEQSSIGSQMLSEFMGMSGSNFRPPSIPSVWYNGLIPYWVQQGWASSSGITVSASSENRPVILYPNKR